MSNAAESHEFQARRTALCSLSAGEVQKSPPRFIITVQLNSPLAKDPKGNGAVRKPLLQWRMEAKIAPTSKMPRVLYLEAFPQAHNKRQLLF